MTIDTDGKSGDMSRDGWRRWSAAPAATATALDGGGSCGAANSLVDSEITDQRARDLFDKASRRGLVNTDGIGEQLEQFEIRPIAPLLDYRTFALQRRKVAAEVLEGNQVRNQPRVDVNRFRRYHPERQLQGVDAGQLEPPQKAERDGDGKHTPQGCLFVVLVDHRQRVALKEPEPL